MADNLADAKIIAAALSAEIRRSIPDFPDLYVSEGVIGSGRLYIRMQALRPDDAALIVHKAWANRHGGPE